MGSQYAGVGAQEQKEVDGLTTTYRTIQGDTWDNIAYKLTGSINFMTDLMAANFDHVDTVFFGAGVILNLPAVPDDTSTTLPPWRIGEGDE